MIPRILRICDLRVSCVFQGFLGGLWGGRGGGWLGFGTSHLSYFTVLPGGV